MISLQTYWTNFPEKNKVKKTCTIKQNTSNDPFDNYCAILLSECFIRSGIDTNTLAATKCWSHMGKTTS